MRRYTCEQVNDHVGKQIRDKRSALGLTQMELGRALGISYQQIQKYETGANRVSAGRLYEIALELDCTIPALFPEDVLDRVSEHGGKNRKTIAFVTDFRALTPDKQAAVGALVRKLARGVEEAA